MRTKAAVACQNSISVSLSVCVPSNLSCRPFVPLIAMHKYIGKWSACFVYPGVSAVFGQQRVLHVKPPIIRHTDHGGKDVDVNMAERHSIGREETDEPERCIEGNQRPTCATREAVASVSTSVPHGGADPVHFRNQIPESQCN